MSQSLRVVIKIVSAAAVVIAACVFAVALPGREVWKIRAELREKSTVLLEETAILSAVADPERELKKAEEQAKNLESRFPSSEALPFVLQQLGDKSKELQLDILSSNPVLEEKPFPPPGTEAPKYEKKKIAIDMRCTYENLAAYLAGISTLPTFFSVEEMTIENKGNMPFLDVRLVLGFYVTAPQKPAA